MVHGNFTANSHLLHRFVGRSAFPVQRVLVAVSLVACAACWGQEADLPTSLDVGVLRAPPFVILLEDGSYSGIAIDLWQDIAREMNVRSKFHEMTLSELLERTTEGSIDVLVAPLTVTAEREAHLDFSHPFYNTGVSIAVRRAREHSLAGTMIQVLSNRYLQATILLASTLLLGGVLVWVLERKSNEDYHGGRWYHGVGAGLWWAVVTISTVGYGDKVPRTVAGRAMAVVLIFSGIMVFSSFTAVIASALTTNALIAREQANIDLAAVRTAVLKASVAETYLRDRGIFPHACDDLSTAMEMLAGGQVDAVMGDRPLLRYAVASQYPGEVLVLPGVLRRETYGFAFPTGSELRESVNQALIAITSRDAWTANVRRYVGDDNTG